MVPTIIILNDKMTETWSYKMRVTTEDLGLLNATAEIKTQNNLSIADV